MKMESMLVRTLARLAISTDDVDREVLRKECGHLLAELEKDEDLLVTPNQPTNLMQIVTNTIHEIGIPAHIKGYRYVREAIMMVINNVDVLSAITYELYPAIAMKFDTTSSRVERAIRHAVEVAWGRGDMDVLYKYFGNTIDPQKGKPTNSEFVSCIAEHITINYEI